MKPHGSGREGAMYGVGERGLRGMCIGLERRTRKRGCANTVSGNVDLSSDAMTSMSGLD